MRRRVLIAILGLALLPASAGLVSAAPEVDIAAVRAATLAYRDINVALDPSQGGFIWFYKCTEQPGVGTMGQHLANLARVGDPEIDPLRPEVLVYTPTRAGGYRLVAVEYVVLAADWEAAHPGTTPTVLGQPLLYRSSNNRYGLPAFYERHLWLWQANPAGTFADWNPDITCLGNGDNGG
jgi:hypothetical protein